MKNPITFPKAEGIHTRQAHCDIPEGLYEREHGRNGFFGPASHILHTHKPTGWTKWEGPLELTLLDLNRLDDSAPCPWKARRFMHNGQTQVCFWKFDVSMPDLARNGDGDMILFFHRGEGEFFCDYGHMSYREGDYINIPRGTTWRLETSVRNEVLTIEATEDLFQIPERGITGRHAQFDLAVLDTPKIDEAYKAQYGEHETRVRAKRRQQVTTVTFPYNFLDTAGWHGDCVPVKLNWRDIRELLSDRYHLPPTVHATFLSNTIIVCTFAPRPIESDPGALKVPFYHNNDEFDESIFYHQGNFFSRDNIKPGMFTLHPSGFHHGPHPKAYAAAAANNKGERKYTDEVAVMIDSRYPLELDTFPEGVKVPGYLDSWKE
ncbi:homogentisate 1,2-dioxygenase [Castellaniella defragrans]|uniref:Homogentisate 1,2-dioxygenase n=2 Tax=Castellaniella defragrans TaxID=75697 RepID=W8X116_CASD6|nr:homogentisate 1,2-dioxygenase [Castellaniella defragrans]KAB0610136.1 homogentisate 1,2-dioxygenase [Castellaniella defragrans]MBB6082083.1 homogentisate 1,2-dioxygenase [Castellaniella defragrans]CDM22977.1 Homogentisate 1,2-dioxygenase [Castellaniella defragrans 65Phen]